MCDNGNIMNEYILENERVQAQQKISRDKYKKDEIKEMKKEIIE